MQTYRLLLTSDDYMFALLKYWNNAGQVAVADSGQTEVFTGSSDGSWKATSHIKNGIGTVNIGYSTVPTGTWVIGGVKIISTNLL